MEKTYIYKKYVFETLEEANTAIESLKGTEENPKPCAADFTEPRRHKVSDAVYNGGVLTSPPVYNENEWMVDAIWVNAPVPFVHPAGWKPSSPTNGGQVGIAGHTFIPE